MRFLLSLLIVFTLLPLVAYSQKSTHPKPKIVVGIVVDQMRYDFLYRYQRHYGPGGFNRLLQGGFSCENTHFNYMPTYTGPGHAAIYSGTTPSVNGVIGNDWFDTEWNAKRYCTTDKRFKLVGGTAKSKPEVGQHSPASLLSSTITDELRLSNNFRSKVASVCLKDRGAILPAGHIPNGCYWFDDISGNWITSSYYPDSLGLPQWLRDYNARRWPDTFLTKTWELGHAPSESFADWNYLGSYGTLTSGFPHDFSSARASGNYGVLRFTPYGNTMVTNFAMRTIEGMQLGDDDDTDFLCISYSATDYCAHQFGIHAEETEDMYVRMDREMTRLLDYLDKKFGQNNVLVFLTADHGGAETPVHLNKLRIPAGVFPESVLEDLLEKNLANQFGVADFIKAVENQQIWLNWEAILDLNLSPEDVAHAIIDQLRNMPGVYDALLRQEVDMLPPEYPFVSEIRRGIHPRRSGHILYLLDPAWHADDKFFGKGGTTHGSPYPYDTHVPLLWYGGRIQPGETFRRVNITDIAPTLASMLRIMEPNGTTGRVIEELMK
jgi:predicted AlkP superfamily pyrophosphatase or phosphodiesterase